MTLYELGLVGGVGYERGIGGVGLIRCPICKNENWAMAVSSGVCSWCGFDANEEAEDEDVSE